MMHWRDRPEGGSRLWLVMIRWCILHVGRTFARWCMFPTALYFYVVRGPERRASREWLERVGASRRGTLGILRHMYTFAMTIVDRVLLFSGRDQVLDIHAEGEGQLIEVLERGHGCLLLGSHLGSFEVMRAFSQRAPARHRHLKVVMDRQQNSLITQALEEIQPGLRDTVIDATRPGPAIVLEAAEVLASGGMVAMLGDRAHRLETTAEVMFLDRPAPLPISPLSIALVVDVPVFVVFGLYEGSGRYRLVFEPLERPGPSELPRQQRRMVLEQWLANYARRVEHYARRYPYNWFNFYDFWNPVQPAADEQRHR
jgi:predicted LPLAT superfamily acyltransferase